MKIPVIRDACGNIVNWFDTMEEAEKELPYMGEEEELSTATIDEVFEHVYGGMSIDAILEGLDLTI